MAIKTREFTMGYRYDIDELINEFLSLECVDELIDIKYQTAACEINGRTIVQSSALVIYKEVERNDE